MKKYCFLFLILMRFMPAMAQQRTFKALSAGLELNIPQRSAYNIGYGVSGKIELPVTGAISLSLTGGYNRFSYKSFSISNVAKPADDNFVPLKAGIKYFFDPRFYTEGELGTVINHNNNNSGNLFTYAIGTGILVPIGDGSHSVVDLGLRFEDWSKNRLQQFAIRAAYRFGF
jgi:hypothetical protein